MAKLPAPEQIATTGDGQQRKFLRMTDKICPKCIGGTGGSRMGVVQEVGDTIIAECENGACSYTEYFLKGGRRE